jgi:hypothetical protein
MSFREPVSLDDSTFLGRLVAWLIERFVLPFADTFSTSAMAVLAVPVGCTSIAIATLGAGILTMILPSRLSGGVLAGGLVVGIGAAVLLLLQARSRFRAAVRRTAERRVVRPINELASEAWLRSLRNRVRARTRARRSAPTGRTTRRTRARPLSVSAPVSDPEDPAAGGPRPT